VKVSLVGGRSSGGLPESTVRARVRQGQEAGGDWGQATGTEEAVTSYVNRAGREDGALGLMEPWDASLPTHRAAKSRLQMCTHRCLAKSAPAGKYSNQMTVGLAAAEMTKDRNRNRVDAGHCRSSRGRNTPSLLHTHCNTQYTLTPASIHTSPRLILYHQITYVYCLAVWKQFQDELKAV
jgi:hypothetical protein